MSDLRVGAGTSVAAPAGTAVAEAVAAARRALGGLDPGLAVLVATVDHEAEAVYAALRRELPGVRVHGFTSSLGVLGRGGGGAIMGPSGAVGVMLFASAGQARFSVGSASLDGGGRVAGRRAAEELAAAAPGAGSPRILLLASTPGQEEEVLAGIAEVFPGTAVYGGSAADHAIAGGWSIFTERGPRGDGVTLAALFGDVKVGAAFGAPYEPTPVRAVVTEAEGRSLLRLDGEPAASVLLRWVGDSIADEVREGGNLLVQTALRPLGMPVEIQGEGGGHFHRLIHPAFARSTGAVDLFAVPRPGESLCLMSGTPDSLVAIVEPLIERALAASDMKAGDARGALLIYCAGCAGAIGARIEEVPARLEASLGGAALLGACTFGEQGAVPGLGNLHANLSVGVVVFG